MFYNFNHLRKIYLQLSHHINLNINLAPGSLKNIQRHSKEGVSECTKESFNHHCQTTSVVLIKSRQKRWMFDEEDKVGLGLMRVLKNVDDKLHIPGSFA